MGERDDFLETASLNGPSLFCLYWLWCGAFYGAKIIICNPNSGANFIILFALKNSTILMESKSSTSYPILSRCRRARYWLGRRGWWNNKTNIGCRQLLQVWVINGGSKESRPIPHLLLPQSLIRNLFPTSTNPHIPQPHHIVRTSHPYHVPVSTPAQRLDHPRSVCDQDAIHLFQIVYFEAVIPRGG